MSGGVRLVDGIPFGRPYRGQSQRPPIPEIPPRKRRRLLFDAEEEDLQTHQGVSDDRQIVIREQFDDLDQDEAYIDTHRKRLLDQPFDGFDDEDDESEDDDYAIDASSEDSEDLDGEDAHEELALLLQDQENSPKSDARDVESAIRQSNANIPSEGRPGNSSHERRVSPRTNGDKSKASKNKVNDVSVEHHEPGMAAAATPEPLKRKTSKDGSKQSSAGSVDGKMDLSHQRSMHHEVSQR